jgi:hypothetical protein
VTSRLGTGISKSFFTVYFCSGLPEGFQSSVFILCWTTSLLLSLVLAAASVAGQSPSPRIDSKEPIPPRLYSLAGRYDNPIPTRFLAPIDCLKIPAWISPPPVSSSYRLKMELDLQSLCGLLCTAVLIG